jgi:hypothetical protein
MPPCVNTLELEPGIQAHTTVASCFGPLVIPWQGEVHHHTHMQIWSTLTGRTNQRRQSGRGASGPPRHALGAHVSRERGRCTPPPESERASGSHPQRVHYPTQEGTRAEG